MTGRLSGAGVIAAASLLLLLAACSDGGDHQGTEAPTTGRHASTSPAETSSASEAGGKEEPTSSPTLEAVDAEQHCIDAWRDRRNDSARAAFDMATTKSGVRHVAVGFAQGDACVITFLAKATGFAFQAVEINPPSGQYSLLWPPAENFDPRPVGWNASANARGYVTLKRPGTAPTPLEHPADSSGFPSQAESSIMGAIPDDGRQCRRASLRSRGADAAVACDTSGRIRVRYESYPTKTALDAAYWRYFTQLAADDVALRATCERDEFAESVLLTSPDEREPVGRVFCFVRQREAGFVWKHDGLRILAIALGRDRKDAFRFWRSGGAVLE
jgi:hypothetical protein